MDPRLPPASTRGTATSLRQPTRIGAMLVVALCAATQLDAGQTAPSHSRAGEITPAASVQASDAVTRAQGLALAGRRAEAIDLLQRAVAAAPANADARVLLGTVLSWEGRYDEARREPSTSSTRIWMESHCETNVVTKRSRVWSSTCCRASITVAAHLLNASDISCGYRHEAEDDDRQERASCRSSLRPRDSRWL